MSTQARKGRKKPLAEGLAKLTRLELIPVSITAGMVAGNAITALCDVIGISRVEVIRFLASPECEAAAKKYAARTKKKAQP